ncbi:MAG: SDR family NAD(P)-dependent oxidoreductase [Candidatus Latescibacteria bacterium]|nr:SDR family NAD(P)-dependent oxidoreductase [Candidatus Latescibacterota bacterium]
MSIEQSYAGKTVLVTGGAGFIGSHLTDRLVALGARVRVLDDLSDGRADNLAGSMAAIEFREGSITDPEALDAVMPGCDMVFHLGANASVPRSSERPDYDFNANMAGTFQVLEAVRRHRAGRLLFASSAAVYGEPQTESGQMGEDHPLVPKSPYGGTKLAGEFMIDAYTRCYDLDHRRVRIFNTFGPRQRKYVMFDLLEKLRRDPTRLEVIGTGDQQRDYNYVEDTATALLVVGAHPAARGRVYNIAGGRPVSIRALVDHIIELTGIPRPDIRYTMESWPGDVVRMVADTTRIGRELDYQPRVGLEAGIRHLIDWHREQFSPPW